MEKMITTAQTTELKTWYIAKYPTDDLAENMSSNRTFCGLFECLDGHGDVYKYIGVYDSVIRERLFKRLAEIMNVDYDYIYNQWMQ